QLPPTTFSSFLLPPKAATHYLFFLSSSTKIRITLLLHFFTEDQKSQGEGSGLMVTAELRKSGTDTDRGDGGSGKISSSGQLPENENHSNTSGAVISNQYREVIASSRLGPMIARIDEALSYLEKMFGLQ
ncbi:hypothetical protein LINPERPRIM_LOCUS5496, partial [Linum perenne]